MIINSIEAVGSIHQEQELYIGRPVGGTTHLLCDRSDRRVLLRMDDANYSVGQKHWPAGSSR